MTDDDFDLIGDWTAAKSAVTGLLIFDDQGRYLMQLRDVKEGLVASGQWSMFGGHIDPGEGPLDCAVREAEEELGIAIDPSDLTPFIRFIRPVYGAAHHYICIKKTPIQPRDIRLGEGAGFGFLTRDQLDLSNFGETARMVMTEYFARN